MRRRFLVFLILSIFILVFASPLETFAARYPSSLRRKIRDLGNERVNNVPVPVLFGITPDNLHSDFGDPRSGGRKHEGQDILAPRGAPIVTPTDAVVIRVGEGDSAGNYVYTANPGGEVFVYLHLDKMSELQEGDELAKGDLIGFVGNTGNASGGVTHVHFEIHDEDGNPMDPFLRLTRIFPLADKIKYLEAIFLVENDKKALAEFLVRAYRREFMLANTLLIPLPVEIQNALIAIPLSAPAPTSSTNMSNNLTSNMRLGSKGTGVVALQNFLLTKNAGVNNGIVADGAFGPRTQRALMDYQRDAGLTPDGVYGPATRAYILSHP